jgi:hypothetical protein
LNDLLKERIIETIRNIIRIDLFNITTYFIGGAIIIIEFRTRRYRTI